MAIKGLQEIEREILIYSVMSEYKTRNPIGFIQNTVCSHLNVSQETLCLNTRKENVVYARYMVMYFARKYTKLSLEKIGQHTGGKDHSTVLHGCNKIEKLIKENNEIRYLVIEIEKNLKT